MSTRIPIQTAKPELHDQPHYIHLAAFGAPTLKVAVRFADEAARVFCAYRQKYHFGASEMEARCGEIYDAQDRLLGRISYNGRIWNTCGTPVE